MCATLFESGADKLCDKTVAVLAEEDLRRERIIKRDKLTKEAASVRISAQHPDGYYRKRCDYILRNNGHTGAAFLPGGAAGPEHGEKRLPVAVHPAGGGRVSRFSAGDLGRLPAGHRGAVPLEVSGIRFCLCRGIRVDEALSTA